MLFFATVYVRNSIYHSSMPRYKLTIAYDGTNFHGWQKQEPPDREPLRTVQGVIEEAVRATVRNPHVKLQGASRTDAGVHAIGQVAAFTSETKIPTERLALAISSRLPDDVQVRDAKIVADSFDPISDCERKCYQFTIAHAGMSRLELRQTPPLFDRHYVYSTFHALDIVRMNTAAKQLIGENDFASFAQINHGRESTIREIYDCSVTAMQDDRCMIEVVGNGFLYNMVRIIAGTLVEVGRGKRTADSIVEILVARDRRAAGPTLPPEGLCLCWIRY